VTLFSENQFAMANVSSADPGVNPSNQRLHKNVRAETTFVESTAAARWS
jgi:hypothetical protein